jgi:hypothetical protein
LRRAIVILILFILIWTSAGFIKPALCHPAEIRDVVPIYVEGATHLSITVEHDIETSSHYVDTIEVTWGANITSQTISPQSLAPDGTFTVDYNMGLVSGTPTILVRARCTITGYSGAISWTGTIPEPSPSPSPTETSSPSPTATASPNPTPSPSIPEFPSFLALSLLVALTVIGALLYKKRQFRFLK